MEFDATTPIWLQLVTEFSRRIVTGEWPAGTRLPGVRELASDLGVNPNTVQRSLAELERECLTYTERTSGRFVTSDTQRIDDLRRSLAEATVDAYVVHARGLGMSPELAHQLLTERWNLP